MDLSKVEIVFIVILIITLLGVAYFVYSLYTIDMELKQIRKNLDEYIDGREKLQYIWTNYTYTWVNYSGLE